MFALALALGVSPLGLLAPRDPWTDVTIGRAVTCPPGEFVGWVRGLNIGCALLERHFKSVDERAYRWYLDERPDIEANIIARYRILFDVFQIASEALGVAGVLEHYEVRLLDPDGAPMDPYRDWLGSVLANLSERVAAALGVVKAEVSADRSAQARTFSEQGEADGTR